jgi:hypothetical protein
MSAKIIINSDESIICPQCSKEFSLNEGIAKHTIEKYESEYDQETQKLKLSIEEAANKEAEKNISKIYLKEIEELKETLFEKEDKILKANQKIEKVIEETRRETLEEYVDERKSLENKLKSKDNSLAEFRNRELLLIKEKERLEDEKTNSELELKRQLSQEREKTIQLVSHQKDEEFKFKEAEYQKKLNDVQKVNDELSKKLENKSQQFSGEVLELILEEILKTSFVQDDIQQVKKGIKGADVIQTVINNYGQNCGLILWEAKRHENWSDKWIQKLKDDQIEANAEIAVLVTTVMPKECNDAFMKIDEVWVISDQLIKPIANALRHTLIETTKQKLGNVGKNEKMELLYDYLNSPQFVQKIRSVISTFVSMKTDLDKEKNALQRIWKKREMQIERVANNMSSMIGELQGIAQDSLAQLNTINELLLPEMESIDDEVN